MKAKSDHIYINKPMRWIVKSILWMLVASGVISASALGMLVVLVKFIYTH